MTDIQQPLSRLGLSQYVERFVEEGFDSWQAILHITESDLWVMAVILCENPLTMFPAIISA